MVDIVCLSTDKTIPDEGGDPACAPEARKAVDDDSKTVFDEYDPIEAMVLYAAGVTGW
jgi:hypothetical protein